MKTRNSYLEFKQDELKRLKTLKHSIIEDIFKYQQMIKELEKKKQQVSLDINKIRFSWDLPTNPLSFEDKWAGKRRPTGCLK